MSRLLELNKTPNENGECILYVMSRDQRVRDNHALLEAQSEAIEHKLPLAVVFNLYHKLGFRKQEHFEFMVEGLKEVEADLKTKNIPFIMRIGTMPKNIAMLASELTPRTIYFDFSPLRHSRTTQKQVAAHANCRVVVVDTHNIVPAWVVSDKEEFAAHTIRRKLHKTIELWAIDPATVEKHPYDFAKTPTSATWKEVDAVVATLPKSGIVHGFKPGEAAARQALKQFIDTGLGSYASGRNDANADGQSNLSPYLHYGQLSSLRTVLDVMDAFNHPPQLFTSYKIPDPVGKSAVNAGIDSFVEELVVRKELADNYCLYNAHYDSLDGAKDWAKKTLDSHANDPREFTYSLEQLENAQTHDDLWNAAQLQLTKSGKIHGYLRMYWAKKILQWTDDPAEAVKRAIELNDTYHLDGGDPNGYVGILWSVAGLHDRPWFDRDVFGTVRYMAESGAAKKFDTKTYINTWTK